MSNVFDPFRKLLGGMAQSSTPSQPVANGAEVDLYVDAYGYLHTKVDNVLSGAALPTGQATMANSVPMCVASDQPAILVNDASRTPFAVTFSYAAAQTDTVLLAAQDAGKTIYVVKLFIQNDTTNDSTVFLETDTTGAKTALTFTLACAKATAGKVLYSLDFVGLGIPCASNKNLGITTTGTTNLTGMVCGYIK